MDLGFRLAENFKFLTIGVIRMVRLTIVIIISLMFVGQSFPKIDPESIVGLWLLDEGDGKVTEDVSGNGFDGELQGNATWVDGKFGKALSFEGATDYVIIPVSNDLKPTETFTLTAWVNPKNGPSSNNHMAIIGLGSSGPRYYVDKSASNFHIRLQTGNDNLSYNAGSIDFDTWQHAAYAYDGENVNVYVNSELVDTHSASGNLLTDNNESYIANWAGAARHFNGLIDEVAVFNVALTEDDIVSIMNNGLEETIGLAAVLPKDKLVTIWASIKAQ
jgi:hypothetical protein